MTRAIVFSLALSMTAHAAGLTFTAPAGWKTVPTSSSMRVAQYALPRAAGEFDKDADRLSNGGMDGNAGT